MPQGLLPEGTWSWKGVRFLLLPFVGVGDHSWHVS